MPVEKLYSGSTLDIYSVSTETELELPLISDRISAGFPSPAMDFIEHTIDLNKHLIKHPSATFIGKVKGFSLKNAGIDDNDLLIIDKSLEPLDGRIAVCAIEGDFTAKRIKITSDQLFLMPENDDYKPIQITDDNDLIIWGIVTHAIKTL